MGENRGKIKGMHLDGKAGIQPKLQQGTDRSGVIAWWPYALSGVERIKVRPLQAHVMVV